MPQQIPTDPDFFLEGKGGGGGGGGRGTQPGAPPGIGGVSGGGAGGGGFYGGPAYTQFGTYDPMAELRKRLAMMLPGATGGVQSPFQPMPMGGGQNGLMQLLMMLQGGGMV